MEAVAQAIAAIIQRIDLVVRSMKAVLLTIAVAWLKQKMNQICSAFSAANGLQAAEYLGEQAKIKLCYANILQKYKKVAGKLAYATSAMFRAHCLLWSIHFDTLKSTVKLPKTIR